MGPKRAVLLVITEQRSTRTHKYSSSSLMSLYVNNANSWIQFCCEVNRSTLDEFISLFSTLFTSASEPDCKQSLHASHWNHVANAWCVRLFGPRWSNLPVIVVTGLFFAWPVYRCMDHLCMNHPVYWLLRCKAVGATHLAFKSTVHHTSSRLSTLSALKVNLIMHPRIMKVVCMSLCFVRAWCGCQVLKQQNASANVHFFSVHCVRFESRLLPTTFSIRTLLTSFLSSHHMDRCTILIFSEALPRIFRRHRTEYTHTLHLDAIICSMCSKTGGAMCGSQDNSCQQGCGILKATVGSGLVSKDHPSSAGRERSNSGGSKSAGKFSRKKMSSHHHQQKSPLLHTRKYANGGTVKNLSWPGTLAWGF